MQLALRPFTTAAVALAGAGFVAVSVAASAGADPADVAGQIASLGESEISFGTTLYNQGDLIDGLNYIINGENNVLVAAPEDTQLAQIESPSQGFYYESYDPAHQFIPTDYSQLSSDLQFFYDTGQSLLSQGSIDTANGATNLGLAETLNGENLLTVGLSEESVLGPLYISLASQQLTHTVAAYEQQYIESVFQLAVNSATPPPIPSVPPVEPALQQDLIRLGDDMIALHGAINTDIIPGIDVTPQNLLDLIPGDAAGEVATAHVLEGASYIGMLFDPSIDPTDKITEGISLLQSMLTP